MTILFCDLVGFTARSDRTDPEDVKARLIPFHARLKREIEEHGGTLDKFIGDAALGVFGWPVAHEDDAERAVRCALSIQSAMAELNGQHPSLELVVRQGITTGEAVVAPGGGPRIGDSVIGDVVNTAARLQTAADPGTILVGEPTYRLTAAAVLYESADPILAKGKREPLTVWRPVAIHRRASSSDRAPVVPFVGRRGELRALRSAFERALARPGVEAVVILGEPGIGKSRLIAHLQAEVGDAARATWVRGRCLPYGEAAAFWPLAEVVSALAGIAEPNPDEVRKDRLEAVIVSLTEDRAERAWLTGRVSPLVGAGAGAPTDREEAFAAWARMLELAAARRPLVVVVEDLQWADPGMLSFLQHLAASTVASPMVLLATARPEFGDHHLAGWDRLRVDPLPQDDVQALVDLLLARAADDAAARGAIRVRLLERAGGNPLFAEELVRSLVESPAADEELPPSLQALIGARLDTLPAQTRALLLDASVIGSVFWPDALAFLGEIADDVALRGLEDLERREFVRRTSGAAPDGPPDFAFWHGLVRDVAYGRIPRAAKAERHRRTIRWLETTAGERLADRAEVVAHHATAALGLVQATGGEGAAELSEIAARYLRLAAVRSMGLDVTRAESQFASALALLPPDEPDRPHILAGLAEAAFHAGRLEEADRRFAEAIDGLRAIGATLEAGDAMAERSVVLEYRGEMAAGRALLAEAIEVLGRLPETAQLAQTLATAAGSALVEGRYEAAVQLAGQAIEVAGRVESPGAAARARGFRGYARAVRGESAGIGEQRGALRTLLELGEGRPAAITYLNLGSSLGYSEGPEPALELFREGLAFALSRGLHEMAIALEDGMMTMQFELGRWDEVLEVGERVVEAARAQGSTYDEVFADADRAAVRACRDGPEALAFCEDVLARAGPLEDQPLQLWALVGAGLARSASGDTAGAIDVVHRALELTAPDPLVRAAELPHLVRLAADGGDSALARMLLEGLADPALPRYRLSTDAARAVLMELEGDSEGAAAAYVDLEARWDEWGNVLEAGHAAAGAGRALVRMGRAAEAADALGRARARFRALGAGALIERLDREGG